VPTEKERWNHNENVSEQVKIVYFILGTIILGIIILFGYIKILKKKQKYMTSNYSKESRK
jgi:uncharacterized membrane protein SpoIIM required for sporulation